MKDRIKMVRLSDEIALTQVDFGRRLGVTGATISRLESGDREPTEQIILAIAREFNVNEHWLRTGEGEMFRPQTTEQELYALLGDLMADKPDFRHRLITVLLRMSPEEWRMLERKIEELAEDMHRGAP